MSVKVSQISKYYGKQAAVSDVSFSLTSGKIYGFLGPNGAGKSTTFKMLTGFLLPDQGHIEIEGYNVQEQPLLAKKLIGYLPEHNPLYHHMYVKEMLAFVGRLHGLKGKELQNSIAQVIGQTGLGKEAHKTIAQLSKGYKQRVGIAQAILHNPKVLILDEPLSGLDPIQLEDLRTVIRELSLEKTLIFSSHILQEVEQLCEHILLINNGKLVGNGPIESLGLNEDKNQSWVVSFSRPLTKAEEKSLAAITNGIEIKGADYTLFFTKKEKANTLLLQWAAQQNLEIEKLQRNTPQLSDVFKSLAQ